MSRRKYGKQQDQKDKPGSGKETFMKRYWMKGAGILFFAAAMTLAGCGGKSPEGNASSDSKVSGTSSAAVSGAGFQTEYGSFDLPSGWVKNEEHSTDDKPLFVSEEYDGNGIPDNISVEHGTSHYTKEQSEDFGEAILKQLAEQSQGKIEGQITAAGENTKSGDPVLVYKLPLSDRVCTQYYIIGDQSYVMVYETNVSGSESCDSAAEEIVNSFQWK